MAAISIRRGRPEDLVACTAVWRSTVDPALGPPSDSYPLYRHEMDTGTLLVAEREGVVCGFTGSVTREDRWFLADVFVSPPVHGTGLGRRLLEALVAADRPGPARATMASSDPRAIALYSGLAMTPRWPCFWLAAPAAGLATAAPPATTADGCDDGDLVEAARRAGYAVHQVDLDYWRATAGAQPVLVRSAGAVIGGGVVRWSTPFAVHDPTAISVGPVFAVAAESMAPTISAILGLARSAAGDRSITCFVPGPNPALDPLLRAGFRIADFDLFCASPAAALDPLTTLPSHDLL